MAIDFIEVQMIGRRRRADRDRERLAEASHRKKCAKHKGRNHWRNWERRKMLAEKKAAAAITAATKEALDRRFREAARAYWSGERETHP